MKLAECLLRRKELGQKINRIRAIKDSDVFETKTQRIKAYEGLEDAIIKVSKLDLNQVTAEFDYYCRQLRLIDARIQQSNWTVEVEDVERCFVDYKPFIDTTCSEPKQDIVEK